MKEQVNAEKKELSRWSLYRQPTPSKKIKSVATLRKKIREFFDGCDDIVPPTPSQLALYLGYASASALYREIANPQEPEYAAELEAAVDRITDFMTVRQMKMAERADDYRGYESALKRIDALVEKAEGRASNGNAPLIGGDVNIQVNVEKLNSLIDDSIDSILDSIETTAEEVK